MKRTAATLIAAALLIVGLAAARSQTPEPAQSSNIMPALLTEVRGLRAAMEQMASAGARVQLALGRLQLQEQRLNTAIKRLDDTHTRLADLQRSLIDQQEQLAMFENVVKENVNRVPMPGQAEHEPDAKQLEMMLKEQQRGVARTNAEIQRLTAEEVALGNDVASEQARWTDLNQRLEELERGLTRR
jgi:predicted nuclease with TOPRIM domain